MSRPKVTYFRARPHALCATNRSPCSRQLEHPPKNAELPAQFNQKDEALTQLLRESLGLVNVQVLDHLLIAGGAFASHCRARKPRASSPASTHGAARSRGQGAAEAN